MSGRFFLDTNILLYSISRHPAEVTKRDIAIALLDADDLGWQITGEVRFIDCGGKPQPPCVLGQHHGRERRSSEPFETAAVSDPHVAVGVFQDRGRI